MRRQVSPPDGLIILLIATSLAIHLLWIFHTRYTEEDAFITFRYAEQIADGNGFVYNPGEPVYGTTTPLFTILLSLWLKFISSDVILGANIFNLIASLAIPIFTWMTLKFLKRSNAELFFTLTAILLSSKLVYTDTNGMEISLSVALLVSSWYAWVKGKTRLTGLLCGLLLWIRVDTVFWVGTLVLVTLISSRKSAVELGAIAIITYLPWIVFATLYFGSPIPHTIIAKWVNYSQFNQTPLLFHLGLTLKYLSPFRTPPGLQWMGTLVILGAAAWGIWENRTLRERPFSVPLVFILLEILHLTLTRATFFGRYFIPILWLTLIFFGMGLGALWDRLKSIPVYRRLFTSLFILWTIAQVVVGISFASQVREVQTFRHEASLKAIGLWLRDNTPPGSRILLEPLGYVGYYSERIMIEEVGLVTPSVTDLKRQQIGNEKYTAIFKPDYAIIHCDDEVRIPKNPEGGIRYKLVKTFNPLGFDGIFDPQHVVVWGSCYEIWAKDR